jgi:hypothetical protein
LINNVAGDFCKCLQKVTGLSCLKSSKISFQRKFHQYLKKNISGLVIFSHICSEEKLQMFQKLGFIMFSLASSENMSQAQPFH